MVETVFIAQPLTDPEFHIDNLTIERVFFEARNAYFEQLAVPDIWRQPVVPQLRELVTRFEAAAAHDATLECRSRVVSRADRSFVMEQVLRVDPPTGPEVATCTSVHVTVDVAAGVAVEIPDPLWAAIDA